MPADEVTHGPDVDGSRARTGPRHAAPKKLLFTRLHMPAGKAIASVAMPTAVLMGMGFTSTLAIADSGGGTPASNSQKAADYKDCVEALGGTVDGTSASPSPSASESTGSATPSPSASAGDKADEGDGKASSPDSGSGDDKGGTSATGSSSSASKPAAAPSAQPPAAKDTPADTPSPSASSKGADGGLLGTIGDAIGDVLTGGKKAGTPSATPTPSATEPAPSASTTPAPSSSAPAKGDEDKAADAPAAGAKGSEKGSAKAGEKAEETPEPSTSASTSPSPSASASDAAEDCEKATDDVGGIDNKQLLADDPWYLNASSLLLKGADYQGVVQVRTASGKVKKVLKYVISDGTDIGDLHQTVKDKASGKTYHVQAGKGTTSTIRDGDTTMYTESISGKLFGLIPITFSPDSPPPLNIPLIYFTDVTVQQAAQFGGTLTIPKLHQYAD
ncbi:hypothetical protein E5083_04105 [Streptomyces bauhiniae]|uniref:Membrane-bound hydrophilic protein n=1 Tax=Streptomyces bauhiniae TaxID=2340725 RepID=A0A4Z1DER8_9ACTN|nr:hypothetical protein [Streptomyces bauhiniae]TGN81696.1 hypothetical protein E5083_04105 [Streptomyces bauhiniae]